MGEKLSTLEKLCMIADRSLGALSYKPDLDGEVPQSDFIDLLEAVKFSNRDATNTYDLFFRTLRRLSKNQNQINQAFKRMIFNYLYNNQDDHVKNHAFQLDRHGKWSLTPAYDMTFMLNPKINGRFMFIDGKRNNITKQDLYNFGMIHGVSKKHINQQIEEIIFGLMQFESLSNELGIDKNLRKNIFFRIESRIKFFAS